ncbi:MAG: C-terminal processing protease CtpA/Prc [Cryomorphaceae bacterium]|jgi:C-terminal processing protease CtpA/Prc
METKHIYIAIIASALFSALSTATIMNITAKEAVADQGENDFLSRIQTLETKLVQEQQARELLQDIVSQRTGGNNANRFDTNQAPPLDISEESAPNAEQDTSNRRPSREEINSIRIERAQPEFQMQRLVDKGFSTEEANWIIKSESAVALSRLNADHERRKAAAESDQQAPKSSLELLREELGEDYYERYLTANGYPTSARIMEVMLGSPGANAGLKPGDKITAYDGKRVFNLSDVNSQTVQGTAGQSVLIEVDRNGEAVQLTIPRGPIGVSGGRRR